MAGYINYKSLPVLTLKEYARDRGFNIKTSKRVLVSLLLDNDNKYKSEFEKMHDKYVPSSGSTSTRQGKLLRVVGRLMYRYYNDGETFSETIDQYPEPYNELTREDKYFISDFIVSSDTHDINNALEMLKIQRETVKRVKEIESLESDENRPKIIKQNESKVIQDTQPKYNYVYVLIDELLEPRRINKIIILRNLEEVKDLLFVEYNFNDSVKENFELIYLQSGSPPIAHKLSLHLVITPK